MKRQAQKPPKAQVYEVRFLLYDSGDSGRFVAKKKVRQFVKDRFSGRGPGKLKVEKVVVKTTRKGRAPR